MTARAVPVSTTFVYGLCQDWQTDVLALADIPDLSSLYDTAGAAAAVLVTAEAYTDAAIIAAVALVVNTVTNADGTVTVSGTGANPVVSLALSHANTWTGQQTFNSAQAIFGVGISVGTTNTAGLLVVGAPLSGAATASPYQMTLNALAGEDDIFGCYNRSGNSCMSLGTDGSVHARFRLGTSGGSTVIELHSNGTTFFNAVGDFVIGGVSASAKLHVIDSDAATNSVVTSMILGCNSSGTAAAGFGAGFAFQLESSTTNNTDAGFLSFEWVDATHATRKARGKLTVYDTAAREALRIEADGARAWAGVPAGSSTSFAKLGGAVFDHFADSGNTHSDGTFDDLVSDTAPAAILATNGEKISAWYAGQFVSSATATREIKIAFAGTTIFDTGALTLSLSSSWVCYVEIIRVSATVIRYAITLATEGAALAAYTAAGELTGLTLSGTNILKLTAAAAGVGAAANDILLQASSASWTNAA